MPHLLNEPGKQKKQPKARKKAAKKGKLDVSLEQAETEGSLQGIGRRLHGLSVRCCEILSVVREASRIGFTFPLYAAKL